MNEETPKWKLYHRSGTPLSFHIPASHAKAFLIRACNEARAAGVTWFGTEKLTLTKVVADAKTKCDARRGNKDKSKKGS